MSNHETPVKQRLHITFGKLGALKYTSNLDLAKVWERVLRRADLPILYSQGFNARPRMQLATALPLGITSECEILDVSLREAISLEGVAERITVVSPTGLFVYAVNDVPINHPALQTMVRSAEYRIIFEDDGAAGSVDRADLQERIDSLMNTDSLMKARKKKPGKKRQKDTNIRPLIYDLTIDASATDKLMLLAHLAVGDQGNVRPDDILRELDLGEAFVRVHRQRMHLKSIEAVSSTTESNPESESVTHESVD